MTFSDLLNRIFSYCSGGMSQHVFVRTILKNFTEGIDPCADLVDDYVNRLFTGKKPLSKTLARKICASINTMGLDTYLYDLLSEDARILLAKDLEDEFGLTSKEDIPLKIAKTLEEIVINTAGTGKPTVKQKTIAPEKSNFAVDYDSNIEESIEYVVKKLSSLPIDNTDALLKYDATQIKNKILPQNFNLEKEIRDDVLKYYLYVEALFKNNSANGAQDFDALARRIKSISDKKIEAGHSQYQIFRSMIEWVMTETSSDDHIACRIVVSFFVQNCEVFHEIPQ